MSEMKRKILIVDDELLWLQSHIEVIEESFPGEFDILTATSCQDAIMLLKNAKLDLVLTDMQMEEISGGIYAGEFLIRHIAELDINPEIIIISGAPEVAKIAERTNVKAFIPKWSYPNYPINLKMKIIEVFGLNSEIC